MLHLWCRHACLVFLQHGLDLEVGLEHFSEKLSPSKRKHLRKHTQHTKPTWLGMATQSRLSCFFLPLGSMRYNITTYVYSYIYILCKYIIYMMYIHSYKGSGSLCITMTYRHWQFVLGFLSMPPLIYWRQAGS